MEQRSNKEELIKTSDSSLYIIRDYTSDIFNLVSELPLRHEPPIIVYDKVMNQRRDVGFFSDVSKGYFYSGIIEPSIELSKFPFLLDLMNRVNSELGTEFNGVLVNRYRDGSKYISAHSDNEDGLDKKKKMVVSLAYGETRTFRIRKKRKNIEFEISGGLDKSNYFDIKHEPCMLIAMKGEFQRNFTHEVPITKKPKGVRISLTFRNHTV